MAVKLTDLQQKIATAKDNVSRITGIVPSLVNLLQSSADITKAAVKKALEEVAAKQELEDAATQDLVDAAGGAIDEVSTEVVNDADAIVAAMQNNPTSGQPPQPPAEPAATSSPASLRKK
jgi:hypothetical protein